MKHLLLLLVLTALAGAGTYIFLNDASNDSEQSIDSLVENSDVTDKEYVTVRPLKLTPISHATFVADWNGVIIFNDPVGGVARFGDSGVPDFVLMSDTHGDHLDLETLAGVIASTTTIIAPQAVADSFSSELMEQTVVLANGDITYANGVTITALPMYNLPEDDEDSRHTKGRGNGYVLEKNGVRVYIAGDTDGINEMRELENIDVAFIPMNPPYTMPVEEAADAVLAFVPRTVYPYHYRTPEGYSDVEQFRTIVNEGNPDIEVILLEWYPE